MLVTPFVTGWDKNRKDFGKNLRIYADSGGFQVAMRNEKVASLDVLRWQERIADIGFTLDIPPHIFSKDYTRQQFLKCMKQSNKNAELMWRFKANDNMELWGVIQGRTFDECKIWYNDLIKNHEYDGYCISISIHKSDADLPWIEQLRFAKTIPKDFHFLGYSSQLFTLVLSHLSKNMKRCYTYDSSTSNIGERYGKYIHPKTNKHLHLTQDRTYDILPCSCPICKKYTVNDLKNTTSLINLHNLFVKISFCEFANNLTDEQFYSYLDNLVKNRIEKEKILDILEK